MNRLLLALVLLSLAIPAVAQESLGDFARQERAKRKAKSTVITNDELVTRSSAPLNVIGSAPPADPEEEDKDGNSAKAPRSAKAAGPAKTAGTGDKADAQSDIRDRYVAQKDKVELLERELNVLQRELQVQTTTFYADAGNRFRDDKHWAEQNQKYQDDIAAKQKALADAKEELANEEEAARKAGVTTNALETQQPEQPQEKQAEGREQRAQSQQAEEEQQDKQQSSDEQQPQQQQDQQQPPAEGQEKPPQA